MRFTKLNDDSSWLWEINGIRMLVDPWFTHSQVDLFPWFSEQFHLNEQPEIEQIPRPDFIFISHPFTDHCNKETLLQFSKDIPIVASDNILKKINKWGHFQNLVKLNKAPISIDEMKPKSKLDLVHSAFILKSSEGNILYAPHGTNLKGLPEVNVIITTVSKYKLPFWLGGAVNLGYEKAIANFELCEADWLLCTHDEQKIGKGLVERLARKNYTTFFDDQRIKLLKTGETFELK